MQGRHTTLTLLLMVLLIQVPITVVANERSFEQTAEKELLLREIFYLTGLAKVSDMLFPIVRQEILILRQVRQTITSEQLEKIESVMMSSFTNDALAAGLLTALADRFTTEQLRTLLEPLSNPKIKSVLLNRSSILRDSDLHAHYRVYRRKLEQRPPLEARVEQLKILTSAQGLKDLEVKIRAEVRKSMLIAVNLVTGARVFSEEQLQKTLDGFEKHVAKIGMEEKLYQNLFLFRSVSNKRLDSYYQALRSPLYQEWLRIAIRQTTEFFRQERSVIAMSNNVIGLYVQNGN